GRYENGGELARALARVGTLNNDPPATDKSSSAVRKAVRRPTLDGPASSDAVPGSGASGETSPSQDGGDPQAPRRPGTSERRVVAVVLCDLGGADLPPEVDAAVRDELGEDTRFEAL